MSDRFFVITGGPGAGKTTLLRALADQGCQVMPEAGRAVIKAAAAASERHPWSDPREFADRMLAFDQASYDAAQELDGPVFFDRGFPDLAGYLALVGLPVSRAVDRAARQRRYNPTVFVAPPWREIYVQDHERTQTFGEAVQTYELIIGAHQAYGYDLVQMPLTSVEDRTQFVLEAVRAAL